MAVRWITPLTIIAILMTTSCARPEGSRDMGDPVSVRSSAAVPFAEFLASVRSASFRDYAGRPGTKARNQQAFDDMRSYVLARYRDARITRSYVAAGTVFDCIEQNDASAVPPTPAAPADPAAPAAPGGSAATPAAPTAATQAVPPCPDSSVPVQRISLGDLVRFPTLRDYLGKSPGGSGELPPAGGTR